MIGRCREDSSLARSPTQTSSNRGSSLPLTTYLLLSYLLFTNDYRPLPAAAKASERGRRTSQRRGGRAALRQRRAARAAHLQVRERRAGRLRPGVREGDHALSGRAGRATWRVSGEGVSPATRRVIGSCHHLFLRRRRVSPPVNRCIVSFFVVKMARVSPRAAWSYFLYLTAFFRVLPPDIMFGRRAGRRTQDAGDARNTPQCTAILAQLFDSWDPHVCQFLVCRSRSRRRPQ